MIDIEKWNLPLAEDLHQQEEAQNQNLLKIIEELEINNKSLLRFMERKTLDDA